MRNLHPKLLAVIQFTVIALVITVLLLLLSRCRPDHFGLNAILIIPDKNYHEKYKG